VQEKPPPALETSLIPKTGSYAQPVFKNQAPLAEKPARKGKESRVLVVDDDESMCSMLSQTVSRAGFKSVSSFTSPFDVLEEFRREPFDIVVTDLNMPGMSGDALIREIKKSEGGTKARFMVVTGTPNVSIPLADMLLKKPFTLNVFVDAVETLSNGKDVKKAGIIIVDDTENTCLLLSGMLKGAGYENVSHFTDPLLALEAFKNGFMDLMITDYDMPKTINGLELIEKMRAARPNAAFKAILHSGDKIDPEKLAESSIAFVLKGEELSLLRGEIERELRVLFSQ